MNIRYSWFPNKIFPIESQWSLFHKFSKWNSFSVPAIFRSVGKNSFSHMELTFGQFFDLYKFERATGMDKVSLTSSLSKTFLHRKDFSLIHKELRFCPECLSKGYHSSIFQLDIIDFCPIHNTKLENTCKNCKNTISTITIPNSYGCPICLKTFCQIEGSIESNFGVGDFDKIINIGNHLKTIKSIKTSIYYEIIPQLKFSKFRHLTLIIWKSLFLDCDEVVPGTIHSVIKEQSQMLMMGNKILYYWKVYRETHEFIYNYYIKEHQKCLSEILKLKNLFAEMVFSVSPRCPIAHAYILWIMYWEKLQLLSQVTINNQHFPRHEDYNFNFFKTFYDSLRVNGMDLLPFAFTCFESFYGFYCMASRFYEKNIFLIPDIDTLEASVRDVICWAWVAKTDEIPSPRVLHVWRPVWRINSDHDFSSEHYQKVVAGVGEIDVQLKRFWKERDVTRKEESRSSEV